MRRVGRPPIGKQRHQLIAIRVDPSVLESLRKETRHRRVGYQTLINEVLAEHARKDIARRSAQRAAGPTRAAAPAGLRVFNSANLNCIS